MSDRAPSPTLSPSPAGAKGPPLTGEQLTRAFEEIRDELASTLMYLLGNRDDAHEAAQEAFLRCWKSRDAIPEGVHLRAWIFRIGLNVAKDLQRSAWNRRVKPLSGDEAMLVGRESPIDQSMENLEDLARLRKAILDLRQEEKEVFLLRQNGGLSYEEIAMMRQAPVGTVKTQMRTALQKLRKVLC